MHSLLVKNEGNHIPSQTLLIGANGHLLPLTLTPQWVVAADGALDAIGKGEWI